MSVSRVGRAFCERMEGTTHANFDSDESGKAMAMLIELPSPLDQDLAVEAEREGVSASEQATFFLQLMTALTREGRKTPFRSVVKAYLQQNSLDADRLADFFESLMAFCLHDPDSSSMPLDQAPASSIDRIDNDRALNLLREWRSPNVHRSIGLDEDFDIIVCELPPMDRLVQSMGRMNRRSIRGKYAHIAFSSEDFMAEKQREIDREDRVK
jgi:hypothetical protein